DIELAATSAAQESLLGGSPLSIDMNIADMPRKRRYLMVIRISTDFSSRKKETQFMLRGCHKVRRGRNWRKKSASSASLLVI
ncbi:hypothetical protein CCACVL1_08588, partial [Corchorus capsularis]